MINKKWAFYLAFVSILGPAIFFIPVLAFIGALIFFFFPPILFALIVMPTICIYSWVITIFFLLLKPIGKAKYILAPLLTVLLFLAIPYHFNNGLDQEINKLIKDDISIKAPIQTGGTLALENPNSLCGSMCQTLLYNNAYQNILIKLSNGREYNYHLENRDQCPPTQNNLIDGVAAKITDGTCLIENLDHIGSTNFTYKVEKIKLDDSDFLLNINATPIVATRLTVIDNRPSEPEIVYRRTHLTAQPLQYPFLVGVTGGTEFHTYSAFYRTQKTLNEPSKNEAETIFGVAALKPIIISPEKKYKIIKAYVEDGKDPTGTAYKLTSDFWEELANQEMLSPQDIELITAAFKNPKVPLPSKTSSAIAKMKTLPEELVTTLGDRLLHDSKNPSPPFLIEGTIFSLPNGQASIIAPQLELLSKDRESRAKYWRAFSRLGDGSPKAFDIYMETIQDYKRFVGKDINRQVMDTKEYEVSGAIIGLCRLGKKSIAEKDDLYFILEAGDKTGLPSSYTAKALIEIVGIDEIRQKYPENKKYKDSDRIEKKLQQAAENKRLSVEKGKNPCN